MAPIEASTSPAMGESIWDFQVLIVTGSTTSSSSGCDSAGGPLIGASWIGEVGVALVGDEIEDFVGDEGSASVRGILEADGDEGCCSVVPELAVDRRDCVLGAETGGSSSHQIPTCRS